MTQAAQEDLPIGESHPHIVSTGAAGLAKGCCTYSERYDVYKDFTKLQWVYQSDRHTMYQYKNLARVLGFRFRVYCLIVKAVKHVLATSASSLALYVLHVYCVVQARRLTNTLYMTSGQIVALYLPNVTLLLV